VSRKVTICKPDRKIPRGRPRQEWIDRVRKDHKLLGKRFGPQLAKHRDTWGCEAEVVVGIQ